MTDLDDPPVCVSNGMGDFLAALLAAGANVGDVGWEQCDFVVGRPKHLLGQLRSAAEVAACEAELAAAGEKIGKGSLPRPRLLPFQVACYSGKNFGDRPAATVR